MIMNAISSHLFFVLLILNQLIHSWPVAQQINRIDDVTALTSNELEIAKAIEMSDGSFGLGNAFQTPFLRMSNFNNGGHENFDGVVNVYKSGQQSLSAIGPDGQAAHIIGDLGGSSEHLAFGSGHSFNDIPPGKILTIGGQENFDGAVNVYKSGQRPLGAIRPGAQTAHIIGNLGGSSEQFGFGSGHSFNNVPSGKIMTIGDLGATDRFGQTNMIMKKPIAYGQISDPVAEFNAKANLDFEKLQAFMNKEQKPFGETSELNKDNELDHQTIIDFDNSHKFTDKDKSRPFDLAHGEVVLEDDFKFANLDNIQLIGKTRLRPKVKDVKIDIPITRPVFYPVTKKVPVPITVSRPVITPITKNVPLHIKVERPVVKAIDTPVTYKVPVYRAKPYYVERSIPVPQIVKKPFTVQVSKPVPVPHYIDKPIPVPIVKDVPYHVTDYKPVVIPVEKEVRIHIPKYKAVPVIVNKDVPIPIQKINQVPVVVTKNIYIPTERFNRVPIPIDKYVPTPVQVIKQIPVPIVKQMQVQVPIYEKVAVPVRARVPVQVPIFEQVPVPLVQKVPYYHIIKQPVSIPIEKRIPVPVPVVRHQAVPVPRIVKSYYPIDTPIAIPYERKIPVPVGTDKIVPIPYTRGIVPTSSGQIAPAMRNAPIVPFSDIQPLLMRQRSRNVPTFVQLGHLNPQARFAHQQNVEQDVNEIEMTRTREIPLSRLPMMRQQIPLSPAMGFMGGMTRLMQPLGLMNINRRPTTIHQQNVEQDVTEVEMTRTREIPLSRVPMMRQQIPLSPAMGVMGGMASLMQPLGLMNINAQPTTIHQQNVEQDVTEMEMVNTREIPLSRLPMMRQQMPMMSSLSQQTAPGIGVSGNIYSPMSPFSSSSSAISQLPNIYSSDQSMGLLQSSPSSRLGFGTGIRFARSSGEQAPKR
ncbi:hypothetical protein ACOME3_004875 [Neoechinorhynchus agilis]